MVMTAKGVATELRAVARKAAEGDFEPALAAIGELAGPEQLAELVEWLLNCSDEVARCASLSLFHVLGFEKFVLVNGEPDFMLRMHVWQPGADPPPGHIHNHRDAIVSTVV